MSTAVSSWTLRRAAGSPLAWLTWSLSLAAVPALELLSPIGLTTRGGGGGGWFDEVLLGAGLLGGVFALESLAEARGLLQRHASARRGLAARAIAASALIFIFPALLLSILFLSLAGAPPGLEQALSTALGLAHLIALAWILALFPIQDGLRSILLVFLAWPLAGWISTASLPTAALAALIDVSHASRIDLRAASWSARMAVLAPIMVLVGACLLIRPAHSNRS